ncbi:hypothetical protein [Mesomycoplasma dispar]|nr:hypothetical protein [Mesomycoplasma dispar]
MNSNNKNKKNYDSEREKPFVFESIMKGLSKNQRKPTTKFKGIFTEKEIENLQIGQINEQQYFGFEEVLVKFFNTLNDQGELKKKELLFTYLKKRIESANLKINLGIKDDKEYINQKNPSVEIVHPFFDDVNDRIFYNEQLELFESDKNLEKYLDKKKKYLFIEENFIKEKKQWNPVIKLIFQLNMARFHLDFIEITQNMIKNIIISIIDFVINLENTKREEKKIETEIDNLFEQKRKIEIEMSKENIQELKPEEKVKLKEENSKKLEKVSEKIKDKKEKLEKIKQKNLQILKTNVKKISDFLTKFFDPIFHYSMKSDYVFQNEFDLRVNNQLAFSKFFEFFTKNLKEKLIEYNIDSPFSILGKEKKQLIEKYFLQLI